MCDSLCTITYASGYVLVCIQVHVHLCVSGMLAVARLRVQQILQLPVSMYILCLVVY